MAKEVLITWHPNRQLVESLAADGVRFVVIGGTAVRFHVPERREPTDLDLLLEPSTDAGQKLIAALERIGSTRVLANPSELAQPNTRVQEKRVFNVDILTPPSELDFPVHWARAEEVTMAFSSTLVRVASKPTLLELMHLAAKRDPARAHYIAGDRELLERSVRAPS